MKNQFSIGKPVQVLPPRNTGYDTKYEKFFERVEDANGQWVPLIFKTVKAAYKVSKQIRKINAFRRKAHELAIRRNSIYIRIVR